MRLPFYGRAAMLTCLSYGVACVDGCRKENAGEAGSEETHAEVSVRTTTVTAQAFTETLGALGVVVPRAGHVASLAAPSPGRVARVLVSTGQRVTSGQPLIELDQSTFASAAQSADAVLTAAQQAYDRAERLAREGIAPRKDVEQAAAELAKARAEAVAARRAEQLATIRAPISGVVTRMSATLGASVDANQPLVEVADPSAVDIVLNLTPSGAARIRPAAKVTLSAGQDASGEPLGIGSVIDIGGTVDSASRSVAVRVQAPTTRRPLRIGETVYGTIGVATVARAIVVPVEALVPEGDAFKVFVVDAGGVAHARPVVVAAKNNRVAFIKSGLNVGERVVTYGAYGVSDSAKVVELKP